MWSYGLNLRSIRLTFEELIGGTKLEYCGK